VTKIEDNAFIHLPNGNLGVKVGNEPDSKVLIVKPGQEAATVLAMAHENMTIKERERPTVPLIKK